MKYSFGSMTSKARNDFFKVLLPRELFRIAFDTFKSPFANTKDFSVVAFWRRHVCFGYFDILDLCSSRAKIKMVFESFGCVFKELECFPSWSFAYCGASN